jgi:hypothetical protein
MTGNKTKGVKSASQKQAIPNLASKSVKTRSISEEDVEEYWLGRFMEEQLDRIRNFLEEHGADEDMLNAIGQAIFDNERWMRDDLDFEGSA